MAIRRLFILFLVVVSAAALSADGDVQAPDNKGTDFFLAFPQNVNGSADAAHRLSIFVAAEQATIVEVSGPEVATTTTSVAAESVVEFAYDATPQVSVVNAVSNKGIFVRSVDPSDPTGATPGAPIAVFGLNRRPGSAGAYTALPLDVLGKEYRAISREGTGPAPGSHVTVVGTEDNTSVTITTLVGVPNVTSAGQPLQITLNRLGTFLLELKNGDLTGTLVTADESIAVFSGNQNGAVVGTSADVADHMIEQMPPISTWGRDFFVAPIMPRMGGTGDRVRVLAHESGTTITINGTAQLTPLGAGESRDFDQPSTSAMLVTTSKPALVVQFKKEVSATELTAPFMMLVPPVNQFSSQYRFATLGAPFSGLFGSNRVNIVVKDGDHTNLLVNGSAVPNGMWMPALNMPSLNGYRYARVAIGSTVPAAHIVKHQDPTVQFGAWVYGQAATPQPKPNPAIGEAYGYAAGQLVTDDTPPVLASVPGDLTAEATGPNGETVTWTDPTATDFGRPSDEVSVICTPASGDVFGLGMHEVVCTATDPAGNMTSESFEVTVVDTTDPELHLPLPIVRHASGPDGVVVIFEVTASDDVDTSVDVTCTPPSGSMFGLGLTLVTCTATDDSGNATSGTFTVTVENTPPMCSAAAPSVPLIWPPNHQMVSITINGLTDADGDALTVRIDKIQQDERANDTGDGNTPVDGSGIGTSVAEVRAERRGNGNGRVYLIHYTATDSIGASCSGAVTVGVPHDQGPKGGPVDDGAVYDSTGL